MPNFKASVYKFVNRLVHITEDKSKGIIRYDSDNAFPQNLVKQLGESSTASACIDKLHQYIFADGLTDEQVGALKVNDTQTLNDIINENSRIYATFRGVALHVSRRADGSIGQVKTVPFEQVRKSENGLYIVNPTFGTKKVDEKKNKFFPAFKGEKVIPEMVSPVGEILYWFVKKPMQYDYPIPSYYSAIEDINADAELSKYELETVTNGFVPSGILQIVGNIDDQTEDDAGKTQWDYINDSLAGFTGQLKDSTGASGRQSLLVLHAKTKEELAVYTPLFNEGVLNATENATRRIAQKVCRSFGVPPMLIGLDGNVGFATNIIADNIELFNNHITPLQEELLTPFRMLFPKLDLGLTKLTPLKYIEPALLEDLTTKERREIIGYETVETDTSTEVSLAQTLGVGGTQSLVGVLQDTILTPEQKVNTLEILFNLPKDKAEKLVLGNVTAGTELSTAINNLK